MRACLRCLSPLCVPASRVQAPVQTGPSPQKALNGAPGSAPARMSAWRVDIQRCARGPCTWSYGARRGMHRAFLSSLPVVLLA
jgi:hypothetical protein